MQADAHPDIVKLLLAKGASEPTISVAALAGAPDFARDTSLTTLGRGFFRVGFGAGSSK